MLRTRFFLAGFAATCLALVSPPATAQSASATTTPHTIVIKLIERPGNAAPFAFEPANFTAARGDTLQFVQFANTMHNVDFKTPAKGAKLGRAAVSPYLLAKGETYSVVIDSRFVDGVYEIVCDPHEMIGMHALLTVTGSHAIPASGAAATAK